MTHQTSTTYPDGARRQDADDDDDVLFHSVVETSHQIGEGRREEEYTEVEPLM